MPQQIKEARAHDGLSPDPIESAGESRLTRILSALLAGYLGLLAAGLLSAMAGLHHAVVVGPLAVGLSVLIFKALPNNFAIPRLSRAAAVVLSLVVAAAVVGNVTYRSNLVVAGRDGGTYANTAAFLVDGADLFPPGIAEPFDGEDLDFASPGFVLRDDGTFWQQFLHSTSSALALVGELFGRGAMFSFNGFLSGVGVMSLFALGRRFMDEWWALAAATLMAASLPFIHYSRGTFTEIPTLVLVAGGLWAADTAIRAQPRYAFGAGLLLGGAAMVRVDAWMVGVALSLFLLTTTWFEEDQETWVAGRVLVGFLTTGILGLFDLTIFAVPYFGLLRASIIPLLAAMVVVRILVPASQTPELVRLASLVQRNRRLVANTLTVVFVAAIGFLWFVRPALFPSRVFSPLGPYGLEPIQIREGLPVDPTRNYAEMTVWWLTWYLGAPLTALGFGGFIAALRRGIAKGQSAIRLPLLVFLVPTITYLVKPSVNADQIWAIRRFTPIVLPGLVLMGLGTAAYFYSRHQAGSRIRKLIVALTLAVSLPVVFTSAPLIAVADRPGVETQFANLCDNLGDAQSIVLVNDVPERPLSGLIGPPLRAWCGVSIAGASPELAGTLGADAVIASSPDLIPGGANFSHILQAEAWEASLTGAPDATEIRSIELYVGFAAR